eukprot:13653861-Alexandrium_andersonii.AAC.1
MPRASPRRGTMRPHWVAPCGLTGWLHSQTRARLAPPQRAGGAASSTCRAARNAQRQVQNG